MPTDVPPAFELGLLSPVTVGHDGAVSDAAFLDALVTAELALGRTLRASGVDDAAFEQIGWRTGEIFDAHGIDIAELARAAVAGGNPVIPLAGLLRARFDGPVGQWVHRGATSQDILDTALMLLAREARRELIGTLSAIETVLAEFARDRRDQVAAARTLTQHAVPTTVGLRGANWLRAVRRARQRLEQLTLPAQLGGAGGTLAAYTVGKWRVADAATLPARFATEVGLDAPDAPWHTTRWPITELGDVLVQVLDAVGVIAADVATLSRTEIGELSEGSPGGSSSMPQKRNPTGSVIVRSAALRAPHLGATLHTAAALAVDERPDGAWHAEWPTLRELLRLALGATAHTREIIEGLRVDDAAVARNLALTGEGIVAERLANEPGASGGPRAREVIDPANYTGLAGELVDRALDEDPS